MLRDYSCRNTGQKQYPHARPSQGIFCTRTLSLRTITTTIGYDMDYTLVHYNAKVKTTPLSLAYVIFEQACQSLSQYGSCMASMKISSLNVCQMTFVNRRNAESVRFGAWILYNYPHGLLDYPRLLFGMSFERSMIRVLDVRIKHLENFPLFMTNIVVNKKDCVPLWASFWRDPKKNSIPPTPSPSTVQKKKK